jgi:hypothetical protein
MPDKLSNEDSIFKNGAVIRLENLLFLLVSLCEGEPFLSYNGFSVSDFSILSFLRNFFFFEMITLEEKDILFFG